MIGEAPHHLSELLMRQLLIRVQHPRLVIDVNDECTERFTLAIKSTNLAVGVDALELRRRQGLAVAVVVVVVIIVVVRDIVVV